MIKIENDYSEDIKESYKRIITKKIQRKYNKLLKNKTKLSKVEQDLFLEESGEFSINKISHLLLSRKEVTKPSRFEGKNINKIIDYKSIKATTDEEKKMYGRYGFRDALLIDINIVVCPYCNRQYITSFVDGGGKTTRTTSTIDHFRPKSKYPALALSLYNFIPSCYICNSILKKKEYKDEILYPFNEGFDEDCVFVIEPDESKLDKKILPKYTYEAIKGKYSEKQKIKLKVNDNVEAGRRERIQNSIKLFHLEEVYQAHLRYAFNLQKLKTEIGEQEDYINFIRKLTRNSDVTITKEELLMYVYNVSNNEIDINTPLSKLTHDILNS